MKTMNVLLKAANLVPGTVVRCPPNAGRIDVPNNDAHQLLRDRHDAL